MSRRMANGYGLIERDAAADVSGHVQIFSLMNGRLAFLESAFGDDLQRQLSLTPQRSGFPILAR